MDKVDEINAAGALADMADHEKAKEGEEVDPGLYDKRHNVKFPVKLMQILDDEKYNSVVTWTPDGKAFVVLKPTILEKEVLPAVFETKQHGNSKFKSFLRKLYRWGFLKKFHQSDDFTYYHKSFQKGNLALCLTITRLPNIKKTKAKNNANSTLSNDGGSTQEQQQQLQQLLANSFGFGRSNPLAMTAATGIPSLNFGAVATQTDAAIFNALKQQTMFLNELIATSSPSIRNNSLLVASNHDNGHEPSSGGTTPVETVLAGTVGTTPPVLSTSSLLDCSSNNGFLLPPGGLSSAVAALQYGSSSAGTRGSAAAAATSNSTINPSLNDILIENQLLRQQSLENDLLFGSTMNHTSSAHSRATAASLLGSSTVNNNFGGLSNPAVASALLSQTRLNQIIGAGRRHGVNPFSSVTAAAAGGVQADSLTNASLLGSAGLSGSQQRFNESNAPIDAALLNKSYRNDFDTMNDVAARANHHQNLLLSSFGAGFGRGSSRPLVGGVGALPSTRTGFPPAARHNRQNHHHDRLSQHHREETPPPVVERKKQSDDSYDGRSSTSPGPTNEFSRIDITGSSSDRSSSSYHNNNHRNVDRQQAVPRQIGNEAAVGRNLNDLIQRKELLDRLEQENLNRDRRSGSHTISRGSMRYNHNHHSYHGSNRRHPY